MTWKVGRTGCLQLSPLKAEDLKWVLNLAQLPGSSPLPSQGLSQNKTPLTCPCIPGEDGLTLDVTGTQLVEKDIENLARGEVKSMKQGYTVLGEIVLPCRGVVFLQE